MEVYETLGHIQVTAQEALVEDGGKPQSLLKLSKIGEQLHQQFNHSKGSSGRRQETRFGGVYESVVMSLGFRHSTAIQGATNRTGGRGTVCGRVSE